MLSHPPRTTTERFQWNSLLVHVCYCLVALVIAAKCARAAEFQVVTYGSDASSSLLSMTGEIRPGDDAKFIALAKTLPPNRMPNWLYTFSNGGDIETALKIGRFLRDKEWQTVLPINGGDPCVSACVLVFAGGVNRIVFQDVGRQRGLAVHRFYFSDLSPGASREDVSRRYRTLKQAIADYLSEMNISQELLTAMESVPPEKVRFLSEEEVDRYRLKGEDAEWNERQTAKQAYMYGVTSAEFRRREAKADASCQMPSAPVGKMPDAAASSKYRNCKESILYQVGVAELEKRQAILRRVGKELVKKTKDEGVLSKCIRAIMVEGRQGC